VKGYFRILMAIPGFFLSSLFVMLFSRSIGPQLEFAPFDYVFAMLITIALWVAVAPLVTRRGKGAVGLVFGKIMASVMKSVMPKIMEGMFEKMHGEDMGKMVHEMMPKMMDGCFSKMDQQQRKGMLSMCYSMLAKIEDKYFSGQDEQNDAHDKETI